VEWNRIIPGALPSQDNTGETQKPWINTHADQEFASLTRAGLNSADTGIGYNLTFTCYFVSIHIIFTFVTPIDTTDFLQI
jgi:hypothetical protein